MARLKKIAQDVREELLESLDPLDNAEEIIDTVMQNVERTAESGLQRYTCNLYVTYDFDPIELRRLLRQRDVSAQTELLEQADDRQVIGLHVHW